MGTKARPGAFDAYHKAEADEPLFVLLARDRHAPMLIGAWADLREAGGEDPAVVAEARACRDAMIAWREARGLAGDGFDRHGSGPEPVALRRRP